MFYLSGVINVLLFLIIRPGVLFPRPEELRVVEPEMELAPQGTDPAIISDTVRFQHIPEPTSAALGDGRSGNIETPSPVSSRRIPGDI
jgi:hypothetical protein